METKTSYDLEKKIKDNEAAENSVGKAAVEKAKENMAQKQMERDAREVEVRLANAERTETAALKELRMNRAKEEAQKKYLEKISTAKAAFEESGDYRAYDKAVESAQEERDKAIAEKKRSIYGDEYWRG